MDAMSFCVVDGDRFIGYAGVITRDIRVRGEMFKLLISPKAELYAGYFRNTVIDLHFPEGKFI